MQLAVVGKRSAMAYTIDQTPATLVRLLERQRQQLGSAILQ